MPVKKAPQKSAPKSKYLHDGPVDALSDKDLDQIVSEYIRKKGTEQASKYRQRKNAVISTSVVREGLFLDQLGDSLRTVFANKIPVPKYQSRSKKSTERILNVLISDTHFGSMLRANEVCVNYGPVEEARRLAQVTAQVADYKRQYRAETELFVHLAGDIIQGKLHDMQDGAPLAEQVASSLHILVQSLLFLASEFKKVTVRCTPGNHGRNTARHQERATTQKWDSIENILYYSIKSAMQQVPNVVIEIDYKPYYVYSAFDQYGFVTHGDTVLKPGNPGKNINVNNMRHQINEFNASLEGHKKVSLFAVGHVHTASIVHLANGATFMSNAPLVPPDGFAQSIGIFDSACGQWLWESVPGRILGDHRLVYVDKHTDKDASLDKIIKPFTGF